MRPSSSRRPGRSVGATFRAVEQGYHLPHVKTETPSEDTVRADNVCAVCGAVANDTDLEDTNGWRWFNDGKGGLLPLCATCPPPDALVGGSSSPRD
jgi:hypothetical protein